MKIKFLMLILFLFQSASIAHATLSYEINEINASAFAVDDAPVPQKIFLRKKEKVILIDPNNHNYGAYNYSGKLLRWGIATLGANWCRDIKGHCRTTSGIFRIYSVGDISCTSNTFPYPDGGAAMPYCMFFHSGQAIHGSSAVEFDNTSHGCVRVHETDAKWLHDEFVERPNKNNHFQGTLVIIKPYERISLLKKYFWKRKVSKVI